MQMKSFDLMEQQDTIRKLVTDDKNPSFFILNITDRPDARTGKATRNAGTLLFQVMSGGQSRVVRVPVSWVPIDAALQAPKKDIVDSAEFQRALSSGNIMVLDHDSGRRIIQADQDSKDEYSRVMAIAQGVNGGVDGYQSPNEPTEINDPWINVSPDVRVVVDEVLAEIMSAGEFRSFLRRSERSITNLDRRYIEEKVPAEVLSGQTTSVGAANNTTGLNETATQS